MAIYQLKTFDDIVSAVLEEIKVQSGDTVNVNRIKRDINIGYNDLVSRKNWRWLERSVDLQHKAYYSTGSASVTINSRTVTLTAGPSISVAGYYFSVDNDNEIYKIDTHVAASTTVTLTSPYIGSTASTAAYKIWTDAVPLPTDCSQTKQVTITNNPEPATHMGMSEFRRLVAINPKVVAEPQFYSTTDYKDPAGYQDIASLPATATRASAGLVKTVKFAANVSSYLAEGDRIKITGASDATYNGEWEISDLSTTTNTNDTITFTGVTRLTESSTADTGMTVQLLSQKEDSEKYRELLVYPSLVTTNCLLHVEYVARVRPLEDTTDEPQMPIEDRLALVYYALYRVWTRMRNPEEAAKNLSLYEKKVNQMVGKWFDTQEKPKLEPSKNYLRRKRRTSGPTTGGAGFFFEPFGSTGSDAATIPGSANFVAVFNSLGRLDYSAYITQTELNYLNGITSGVVSLNDVQEITNKTINAASNTITNIVNANISGGAAITRSKLASGNNYRILANDGSGVMSENAAITASRAVVSDSNGQLTASTATATEVGYLSGVTSNIQSQLNAAVTSLTNGYIFVGNASNVPTGVAMTGDIAITNAGVTSIASGVIVDADVSGSAAITRSKTATGNAYRILANDVSGVMSENAAITASRAVASDANGQLVASSATATELGYLSGVTSAIQTQLGNKIGTSLTDGKILVGNVSNVAAEVTPTGDVTISNAGVTAIAAGVIVDNDINASAAITRSKTATGTAYRILANNASGVMSENAAITASRAVASDANGQLVASSTTATELGYVSGVTSAIQTQLDAKQTTALADGKILVGNVSNLAAAVTPSGDVTISNAGVTAIASGVIVDADISASAAITRSKTASGTAYRILANNSLGVMSENSAITASRAVASDANGQLVAATTTATELGYVNGVTSAIQTQLDGKVSTTLASARLIVGNGSNVATAVDVTGDVTISNAGVTAIGSNKVTNGMLATVATATFKGRTTAGTGNVEDLTATQATALLNNVVGDSGSGGTKGLVPAPAAGDAAAGKFLKADGTWTAPSGSGDVVGPASSTDNAVTRFDGTTGKLLQNSGVTISDTDVVSGVTQLNVDNIRVDGNAITSTDTNGSITITPNGTGDIVLDGQKWPQADGSDGQFLKTNGLGQLSWYTPTGSGDVVGPGSATDNAVARFDSTTGKLIQNSAVTIDDTGIVSGVTQLNVDNIRVDGNAITSTDLNGSITITPNGSGDVVLDGVKWPQADGATSTVLKTNGAGQTSWALIADANIDSSAAITRSKTASGTAYRILANNSSGVMSENAAITASRAVASDANGQLVAATTTATELGYVNGVTSAIQTQLDGKIGTTLASARLIVGNGSNVATAVDVTGDVTISNAGVTAIGSNKVTNGMLATVSTATFKGRTTAGTGNVEDLSASQATALLNNFVGDSGSGGTKGLVPAPSTGDSGKYLKGDGTWATVSGTGDVVGPGSATDNAVARFDSTTGKLIQNSVVTVDDVGVTGGITQLNVDNLRLDGNAITSTDTNGSITITPNGTGDVVLDGVKWPQADGAANTVLKTDGLGQSAWALIANANIDGSAAIARSKLASGNNYRILANDGTGVMSENAAITASRAVVSDANGQLVAATTTSTEIGYVNGVTSAIQTQIDGKLGTTLSSARIFVGNGSNVATGVDVTGDVTISNAGVTAIGSNKVTNAMLATVATATFKGRTTAGTGNVEDLTATQATALLNNFVGDSGSGGTKGLVPAPSTGDSGKYLKGDGTWATVSGTGDVVGPASATDNAIARFDTTTGKLIQNSGVLITDTNTINAGRISVVEPGTLNATTHKNGIIYLGNLGAQLPSPADGIVYTIIDNTYECYPGNGITINRFGSENINGVAASYALESPGGKWEIYCDGTDWWVR